jgi:hypothetical protein
MSGAIHADKESEKGRVGKARVKRYWAGVAPAWAEQDKEEEQAPVREATRTAVAPVIVKKVDDPRLARLSLRDRDEEGPRERHREIRTAEVVRRRRPASDDDAAAGPSSGDEQEDDSDEEGQPRPQEPQSEGDEEEIAKRRLALRERCVHPHLHGARCWPPGGGRCPPRRPPAKPAKGMRAAC